MDSASKKPLESAVLAELLRDRINALVVCLSNSWGGLEQVAAEDATDAGALGLNVRVLCLEGSPIHEELASRKEVNAVPVAFRPRNYFDLKLKAELERLLQLGVNLVHTHQTSLLGSIIPWLWKRPSVAVLATRHMMCGHDKRNIFHASIYGRLDAMLVMSDTLKQNVLRTHPILERRVKVVNLGLDFERFDPAKADPAAQRAHWGVDSDTIVIGVVGRIDPAKGQGTFIKAAAGLLKRVGNRKLKFVIVGEETLGGPGSYLETLKQMVSQFRLDDHVVFAGFQENVPEVMRALDIFVMPSRQETFGLVAIEAMAMERPIVISSGGSAREIIGNEEFGLMMRPDDAFDLQARLRHLLERPAECVEMGRKARQHVLQNYDRLMRVRRTLEIYDRALRRRGTH